MTWVPLVSKDDTCHRAVNQPGLGCDRPPPVGTRAQRGECSGHEPSSGGARPEVSPLHVAGRGGGPQTCSTLSEPCMAQGRSGQSLGDPKDRAPARRGRHPRAYLVFHSAQAGANGVAASVLALLCRVKHQHGGGCARTEGRGRGPPQGWGGPGVGAPESPCLARTWGPVGVGVSATEAFVALGPERPAEDRYTPHCLQDVPQGSPGSAHCPFRPGSSVNCGSHSNLDEGDPKQPAWPCPP